MKSRSRQILDKSLEAIISAIEIYNKPAFNYREEAFAILATNAWELLLKARILQLDGKNRVASIVKYEKRQNADGSLSKRLYRTTNRSGNPRTIGLFEAYSRITDDYGDKIDAVVLANLGLLTKIRDNSVHFYNKDFNLRKKIHEVGTANLKNYLYLVDKWFSPDLEKYQFFLMPIAFIQDIGQATGMLLKNEQKNLIDYISHVEKQADDDVSNNVNLTLDIEIKLKKVSQDSPSTGFTLTSSKDGATKVILSEEDIREKYPWDYGILTTRLKKHYSDFKVNNAYHEIRKEFEKQERYCFTRYLDTKNKKSFKRYYNPNIVKAFEAHYTKSLF